MSKSLRIVYGSTLVNNKYSPLVLINLPQRLFCLAYELCRAVSVRWARCGLKMNRGNNYGVGGGGGTNYNHPRAYSSDFSDFGGDNDPWYAGSPEKPNQSSYGHNNPTTPSLEPSSSSYMNQANESMSMNYTGRFDLPDEDYSNEPPLLEEIGIRFDHIWTKTQAVILLNKV